MTEAIRADLRANTHVLYRFFSKRGQLLYVGITNDPSRRFDQHCIDKPWWPRVADIKIERFTSRAELTDAEIKAIQTENPRYNRAHAQGVFEEIRPKPHGRSLWLDASRFGNAPPRHHPDEPMPPRRLPMPLSCPSCNDIFCVFHDADEHWNPVDDTVHCDSCGSRWTDREWRRAALGF